tara:strand:+ start:2098 stop:3645 length:1548 start_codon:yes stop_codon:yes gene_type:complete
MVDFSDISLAFDDIIDTPAKRRRQVDAASQQIRGRYDQSRHPFALLAGGIAGSIPGITENVRRAGRDMGGRAFQTQGENLADQLRGIDTSNIPGQNQAIAIVAQADPGQAQALKQMFDQRNIEAEQRAFQQTKFQFEQDQFEEQKRAALVNEGIDAGRADTSLLTLNQRVAEFNAEQMEGEGLAAYNRGIAAQFGPTAADGTPNPQANPQLFAIYSSAAVNGIPHAAVAQSIDAIAGNRTAVDRELQIQAIANDTGMTSEAAENLLFQMDNGIVEIDISEDGQVTVVDVAQQMANIASGNTETQAVTRLSQGVYKDIEYGFQDTLYSMANVIPGVINKTTQVFNRIAPQIDPSLFSQRQSVAEALVNNVSLDLYAAVRESLGAGRLSNVMIKMIEDGIGIKGKFFDSEQNYRSVLRMNSERLRSLSVQLRSDLEQGIFSDSGRRSDAQQQLSALNKAIQQFGVPPVIAASEFTPELIAITSPEILVESVAAMGPARFNELMENSAFSDALEARGL